MRDVEEMWYYKEKTQEGLPSNVQVVKGTHFLQSYSALCGFWEPNSASAVAASELNHAPSPDTSDSLLHEWNVWCMIQQKQVCFAAFSHMTDFFFYFNLKVRTWHWSLSFLYHQGNHLQFGANRSHWNWLISQSGPCFVRATETELGLKLVSESSLLLSEMTM